MAVVAAQLSMPWMPAASRRPASAGVNRRAAGPPRQQQRRRPQSAQPRRSQRQPAVVRQDERVDVEASWPGSFDAAVSHDDLPTMASGMAEHASFVAKSANRRARVGRIVDALQADTTRKRGAREVELTHKRAAEWARTCRHLVHGAHAEHGSLGRTRGPPAHRHSAGPRQQRPWSASAADRSRSPLNLGLSKRPGTATRTAAAEQEDPVERAIRARRERSESWGRSGSGSGSEAAESSAETVAVPTQNGTGWTALTQEPPPASGGDEDAWLGWVERTALLRAAPLNQVGRLCGKSPRWVRAPPLQYDAEGSPAKSSGSWWEAQSGSSTRLGGADSDAAAGGKPGGAAAAEEAEEAEEPKPYAGWPMQMLYLDMSMARFLVQNCTVPSIAAAAKDAIRSGPVRAEIGAPPPRPRPRRAKSQATAQATAAAQPQVDVEEEPDEPNEDLPSAEASGIDGGEEMQAAPSAADRGFDCTQQGQVLRDELQKEAVRGVIGRRSFHADAAEARRQQELRVGARISNLWGGGKGLPLRASAGARSS